MITAAQEITSIVVWIDGGALLRHRKELGDRKDVRVDYQRPAYLVVAPDGPWLECFVLDVSDSGVCLDVGALVVPKLFGVAFNAEGKVMRICKIAWRRGARIGARFVTAKELRRGEQGYSDPRLKKLSVNFRRSGH